MNIRNQSLGFKVTGLLIVLLVLVFGTTALLVLRQISTTIDKEAAQSASELAQAISNGTQAFGETGEMDGLNKFLENVKKNISGVEVRAVRAPATVEDYGERRESPQADSLELEAIKSAQTGSLVDPEKHTVRFVVPLINGQSCRKCHKAAALGAVLGTSSSLLHTDEIEAAKQALTLNLIIVFAVSLVVVTATLLIFLRRTVIAPLHRLSQVAGHIAKGDIEGAEKLLGKAD